MPARRNSRPRRAGRPRSPRPPFQHPSPEARPRTGVVRIWRDVMTSKSIVGADKRSDLVRAAPLGALLRYADGQPRPPARFNKKLAAWERTNGVGRLIKKTPADERPTYYIPEGFTIHHGYFGCGGVIVMVVKMTGHVTKIGRAQV